MFVHVCTCAFMHMCVCVWSLCEDKHIERKCSIFPKCVVSATYLIQVFIFNLIFTVLLVFIFHKYTRGKHTSERGHTFSPKSQDEIPRCQESVIIDIKHLFPFYYLILLLYVCLTLVSVSFHPFPGVRPRFISLDVV